MPIVVFLRPLGLRLIGGVRRPCIWVYRGVGMFVVLHCMLERACVSRRWIWLRRTFDASPHMDRVLAYVRRRLPLYVGHELIYPTGWPFCFFLLRGI